MKKILLLVSLFALLGCKKQLPSIYTSSELKVIAALEKSDIYKALMKAEIPVMYTICNNVLELDRDDLGVHMARGKHHGIAICMGRDKSVEDYLETLQHEAIHALQFCESPYTNQPYFLHSENVKEAKEDGSFKRIDEFVRAEYEKDNYEIEFEAFHLQGSNITDVVPEWIEESCILTSENAPDIFFN